MCYCSLDSKFYILKEFYHYSTRKFFDEFVFLLFTEIDFTFSALINSHEMLIFKLMLVRRRRDILRFEIPKLLSQQ